EVGFSDCTAQRIEYKKLLVVKYLLEHSDDYVTGTQLNLVEEMNSIDLSKSISSIKMGIMKVLTQVYDRDKSEELWNQIIDRKKINGRMGYMLVTEGTELVAEDLPIEMAADHKVLPNTMIEEEDTEALSVMTITEELPDEEFKDISIVEMEASAVPVKKGQEEAVAYLPANWLMLFAIFYAGIMLLFIMNARDLTYGMLLTRLIELPIRENLLIFIGMSVLPVLAGVLIDTPIALFQYKKLTGRRPVRQEIRSIVMTKVPRFDLSINHILFFLLCNLTGAMTVVSMIYYVGTISHYTEYLNREELNLPLMIIALTGVLVALYNNYALQTKVDQARNNQNYILTRAHALLNLIWLAVSLAIICSLMFAVLLFGLSSGYVIPKGLDSSFCILLLAAYSYLWFSSNSPLADHMDSISNGNFLAGAPILSLFSVLYTIRCFDHGVACYLSFAITAICLALWLITIVKVRHRIVLRITTSFFFCMAGSVILLLIFLV
ncbi:MAG: hypothetical protein IJ648_08720, partial [Lachnospiraceae bacterium]|nr:hypothetical protein [Lachnospiraceae bacterium]